MKNLIKGTMLAVAFLFALTISVNAQSSDVKPVKAEKTAMAKVAKTVMSKAVAPSSDCTEENCTCETTKGDKKATAKSKADKKSKSAECTTKEEECTSKCGEGKEG